MRSVSLKSGYFVTILGNALFFLYLYIISINLSSVEYAEFRYWFNAAALLSQFFLFGLDVCVIKEVKKSGIEWVYGRSSIYLFGFLTAFIFSFSVLAFLLSEIYLASLFALALTWSCSNYFLAFVKTSSNAIVAIVLNSVFLRVVRIVFVLPILFYSIGFQNLALITISGQLLYMLMLFSVFVYSISRKKVSISKNFNYSEYLANFITVASIALILKSDVVFSFLHGTLNNYKFVDYSMIIVLFFHISHQIIMRNEELYRANSAAVQKGMLNSSHKILISGVFVITGFMASVSVLEFWELVERDFLTSFLLIVAGYLFYFSFGPTIEKENLIRSTSLLLGIVLFGGSITYLLASVVPPESHQVAFSVSTMFVTVRLLHIAVKRDAYNLHDFMRGLVSAVCASPFYLYAMSQVTI